MAVRKRKWRKSFAKDPVSVFIKAYNVMTKRPDIPDEAGACVYVRDGKILWIEGANIYLEGDTAKCTYPTTFVGCELFER